MKICLLSDQYSQRLSGIGLYTNNLVDGLRRYGHQIILLCNERIQMEKKEGLEYIYLAPYRWDPTHSQWVSLNLRLAREINELWEKYRFDIFHSLDARQGALAAKKLMVPTVGSVNDYYFATSSLNPFYFYREYRADWAKRYFYNNFTKFFERTTLNNYDLLITNSRATGDEIIKSYHLPGKKVRLIYKAISHFPSKRIEVVDRPDGAYNVLMVGKNLQRKGIYYLIEASSSILAEYPELKFIIVGQTPKDTVKRCKRLGVDKNFYFHGVISPQKIQGLYAQADIFVLPSIAEGLGVTIIEAMSYGIPVVASDVGGIKDLIENGKNGLLVQPRDSFRLSEAILGLLKNRAKRDRLSGNAFQAAKGFNIEKQVRETIELYKDLKERMKR